MGLGADGVPGLRATRLFVMAALLSAAFKRGGPRTNFVATQYSLRRTEGMP